MKYSKHNNQGDHLYHRIVCSRLFRMCVMLLFIIITFLIFNGQTLFTEGMRNEIHSGTYADGDRVRSFGIDGEMMNQLLLGFGSDVVADDLLDLNLNCDARILREEIVGTVAIVDVILDCECEQPDDDVMDLTDMRGEWKLIINR